MTRARVPYVVMLLTLGPGLPLHAQGVWDAILTIDPYPSPYYSDWDANPDISTLTLINTTAASAQVRIHFNVTDRTNRIVLSGASEPELVGAGATVIFDSPYDVAGSTTHDAELEEQASRTGRLPEGEYTACAAAADGAGFVLAEACSMFTIVYPDPPLLLGPMEGEVLEQGDPLFTWTPVHVPIDYQLTYVVRIAEVLQGQSPAEALRSNIPHFQSFEERSASLRYPIDARPLEPGKQYAWTVQALDQNGYAASANDGRSEIWSFHYGDGGATPATNPVTSLNLTVRNAGGDVARFDRMYSDSTSGLWQICAQWNAPVDTTRMIVFPLMSRFVFRDSATVPAFLVRDTTPDGTRRWTVGGSKQGDYMLMLTGSCVDKVPMPRWIGIRTLADAQEVGAWLQPDTVAHADSSGFALKFGVAILSLFEESAGADSPPVVQEFLEGHTIDLKTGINVYGILDAREWGGLWDNVLSYVYEDDEHEVELQGFVGFNQALAVRLGAGERTGAEISDAQEYLTLSAMLPAKTFDNAVINSVRLGIEISLGDSTATAIAGALGSTERARDLLIKPTVEVVTHRDITWTGTVEFDLGMEAALKPGFTGDNKVSVRLKTDHEFQPGPLANSVFALGHPEVVLDIEDGFKHAIKSRSFGQLEWDFSMRGSLVYADQEVATLGVTVGRKADKPQEYWQQQVKRSEDQLDHDIRLLSQLRQSESDARLGDRGGDTATANAYRLRYAEQEQVVENSRRQLRRDSVILAGYDKRYAAGNMTPGTPVQGERGKKFWQASLALGNMGLPEILDLLLKIPEARREEEP